MADGLGVDELRAEHEALMQFLYLAPVGLVQAGTEGEIAIINPIAAQLLMPLSPDGDLANLFDVLDGVAPGLRAQCAAFPERRAWSSRACTSTCVRPGASAARPRSSPSPCSSSTPRASWP
ncbi:hypothetical protein [Massilia sp. Dwa41.01b]|uniref:hypothetical protein n=1 Tax=Massilia sp. Dwa41.01b TaxID=2709302 RepID=UPI001E54E0A5|nr:hypothetical protein [Massilia sp. Dwa41.01b]